MGTSPDNAMGLRSLLCVCLCLCGIVSERANASRTHGSGLVVLRTAATRDDGLHEPQRRKSDFEVTGISLHQLLSCEESKKYCVSFL